MHMKEALKGASSALIIRIVGSMLGFAVSVLIARLLGAEGSGIYFLTLSVIFIAVTLGSLGFFNTTVRFVASHAQEQEWGDVRFVYRTVVRLVSIATALISMVLFIGADWLASVVFENSVLKVPLQIAAGAVIPLALALIHAECLRGLKKISATQWIKTCLISGTSLFFLYPAMLLWGVNGAMVAYIVAVMVTAGISWYLWRRACVELTIGAAIEKNTLTTRTLMQSSWPLYGVEITGLLVLQSATIFLGVWGNEESVGVFNIANQVASLLLFPVMAMISILAPKFSAMYRRSDMEELRRLACSSSKFLMMAAILASTVAWLLSEWLFSFFGPEFDACVPVFKILLMSVIVNASTGAVSELLMMTGHESMVRNAVAISAAIQLPLCVLLIQLYGAIGAAIAILVGTLVWNCIMVFFVKKVFGFYPCWHC